MKIAVLPGDGIGPEIIKQAVKVIKALGLEKNIEYGHIGGDGYNKFKDPLPKSTLDLAQASDAILMGSVGDPKYDQLPRDKRPERGLLRIRQSLNLFANLRPAIMFPELIHSSSLKPEVIKDLDIMIIRELTGDIYFGEPRGIETNKNNEREGLNTMRYSESEIKRIAHVAFKTALKRSKKLCSVDKANVLEATELWRDIMIQIGKQYPEVELSHMYVDNASMQLVKNPKQFDVIATGNIFGDILSDQASMLTGSIGMLPSASLDENNKGMYEPIHGSAPDIAGLDKANPLATILSLAMMFKYTFNDLNKFNLIENAVRKVLREGYRTEDIFSDGLHLVGCEEMGDKVIERLEI
ncbi:MAG: 3-isopropylmalate dehydrogenase [Methylophilaceae bacterium]|tara:strand:+ start:641 stop:1702 length:1062 start_codon:yes stop_codon:yes gene_type:complete